MASTDPDAVPPMTVEAMIERAKSRDYWPDQATDWRMAAETERQALLAKPECQDFVDFMFPSADRDKATAHKLGVSVAKLKDADVSLKTDGLMVIKGGRVLFENYVGPYAGHPEKLHCMWSASKSFTAGLVGALAEASSRKAAGEDLPFGRVLKDGQAIGLNTKLKDLTDVSAWNKDPAFGELTVEQFLAMAPNLEWRESYDDAINTSSIVHMLWVNGYKDMATYAADQPFGPEGPGQKFNYSSGNAVILMRAFQELYGEKYASMPWDVLFDRLGMNKVAFERDRQGTFVGSSYVHTTLRDMAKFGYAYLNGGYYKDQQVIQSAFVDKARQLSIGMAAAGTTDKDIEREESFYGMGFWLNSSPKVLAAQGVRSFGPEFRQTKFFPNVPADAFFAAGHYGQNILIFPKQDLMVVRMSHDKEYWTKLDRMMSKALSCFGG